MRVVVEVDVASVSSLHRSSPQQVMLQVVTETSTLTGKYSFRSSQVIAEHELNGRHNDIFAEPKF